VTHTRNPPGGAGGKITSIAAKVKAGFFAQEITGRMLMHVSKGDLMRMGLKGSWRATARPSRAFLGRSLGTGRICVFRKRVHVVVTESGSDRYSS